MTEPSVRKPTFEELEANRKGKQKTGFHCEKHNLSMFSMDYCPICASEKIYGKEEKEETEQ